MLLNAEDCAHLLLQWQETKLAYVNVQNEDVNESFLYESINKKIDAGVAYSAYCDKEMKHSQASALFREIRSDAKTRDIYAKKILQYFRKKYGKRAKVHTVYQSGGTRRSTSSGAKNMPSVGTRPLPPIQRF